MSDLTFYPGSVLVILGYQCTNNCSYCYLKKNGAHMEQNMSLETFEKAIDWYEKFISNPDLPYIPSIALIGGEPLKYWDSLNFEKNLPRISEIVHKYGKEIRLVSNGILLTEKRRKLIRDYDIHMDISMDGFQAAHDLNRKTKEGEPTWEKAMRAVQWLMEDNNDLRVRATVAQNNAKNLFEMYHFLYELGCKRWGIEVDTFSTWSPKRISWLSVEYDKAVEHYVSHYDPDRSCFSFDRTLKMLAPNFVNSSYMDTKFLRPNSIAILPPGDIQVNHNFPVWSDIETAKYFEIGNIFTGLDEDIVQGYLDRFGLMTESSYFAQNEESVCKTCPAAGIMCQNPWINKTLPRSVWIPNHDIQCYALRLVALYGEKYLKKYGYKK